MIEKPEGKGVDEALAGKWPISVLLGGNFSGRTHVLRHMTGLACDGDEDDGAWGAHGRSIYVGPEVYNSVSGLGPTVREEVRLHASCEPDSSAVAELIEKVALDTLYERNPFDLSGGEQALLSLISALALEPDRLAIDGALEQVDSTNKRHLLNWLSRPEGAKTRTVIADNFSNEFVSATKVNLIRMTSCDDDSGPFGRINGEAELPVAAAKSCRIKLDRIQFRYSGGAMVLNEVSAELEPGSLYFLEGRNGAGKTTLAKILSGMLRPVGGRLSVDDTQVPLWRAPGQIFAYHYQNPDVGLFSESVEKEIQTSLGRPGLLLRLVRLFGKEWPSFRKIDMEASERTRRLDAVVNAFGLRHVLQEHPLDLPFVMRKRVALATTVAMGCPWLILDEPTLGQDKASTEAIARAIEQLLGLGTGVIVISHSSRLRRRLSAPTLTLVDGVLYHQQ